MEKQPNEEAQIDQPNGKVQVVKQPDLQIYRQRIVIQISRSQKQTQMKQYLSIITKTLQVDKQLNLDQLKKTIKFDEQKGQIIVQFGCIELKLLRSCITGFLRHMQLAANTIKAFRTDLLQN